jgi:hypothetical protein
MLVEWILIKRSILGANAHCNGGDLIAADLIKTLDAFSSLDTPFCTSTLALRHYSIMGWDRWSVSAGRQRPKSAESSTCLGLSSNSGGELPMTSRDQNLPFLLVSR